MTLRNRTTMSSSPITRRKAIQVAGSIGVASAFGSPVSVGAAAQSDDESFPIPETGVELPSDDVMFTFMTQGPGPRTPFYEAFFSAYQEAHPNIKIQYDELPNDQIAQVMSIAIQDGQAPDLFFPAGAAANIGQSVAEGWITPLDDIVPDFQHWKGQFPQGVFVDGITVFDGKTYTFPLGSNKRYGTLLFFNSEYMEQAGIDPGTESFTWDRFREAASTLTSQGNGQYYGLALGAEPAVLTTLVGNLAVSAGAAGGSTVGGNIDWTSGEYTYTRDEYLAAIELLIALQDDGSLVPGALTMTARDAEPHVTQGTAAMTLDGPWVIARWQERAPEFTYGLAAQPMPNVGTFVPIGHAPGGANYHVVSNGTEYPEIAGDILAIWGSPDGQESFQTIVGGSLLAIFPEAQTNADLDAVSQKSIEIFDSQMRLHPDPRVRREGAGRVYTEHKGLQPDLGEVVQGILSGQVDDPKAAMQDLQDRADAELDRAIKAAQEKGAEVSRDDWVFPNWEPTRDYTEDDYAALDA